MALDTVSQAAIPLGSRVLDPAVDLLNIDRDWSADLTERASRRSPSGGETWALCRNFLKLPEHSAIILQIPCPDAFFRPQPST
jgi:hypothetical protein